MRIKILLREIREQKNISLSELSKITGISKSHLSNIERQEKMPSFIIMCIIADKLHISIEKLYEKIN